MSMPLDIVNGDDIPGCPGAGKQYDYYYGPRPGMDPTYGGDDPNDIGTWHSDFSETTIDPPDHSILWSGMSRFAEYPLDGTQTRAIFDLNPFTTKIAGRYFFGDDTVVDGHGTILIEDLSLAKRVINCSWDGAFHYSIVDTVETEPIAQIGLLGLYPTTGSTMSMKALAFGDTAGTVKTGQVVGLSMGPLISRMIAERGKARAFATFPIRPGLPSFEAVDLTTAAGMAKMREATIEWGISYIQPGGVGTAWYPTGTVTGWSFTWRTSNIIEAYFRMNGLGALPMGYYPSNGHTPGLS